MLVYLPHSTGVNTSLKDKTLNVSKLYPDFFGESSITTKTSFSSAAPGISLTPPVHLSTVCPLISSYTIGRHQLRHLLLHLQGRLFPDMLHIVASHPLHILSQDLLNTYLEFKSFFPCSFFALYFSEHLTPPGMPHLIYMNLFSALPMKPIFLMPLLLMAGYVAPRTVPGIYYVLSRYCWMIIVKCEQLKKLS